MSIATQTRTIDTRKLDRLTKRRDDQWTLMVKEFEALHAKQPDAAKTLWKTLCRFEDAADAVSLAILNDQFEDKGRLIDRVMIFNTQRSNRRPGAAKGGHEGQKTHAKKRGWSNTDYRDTFERVLAEKGGPHQRGAPTAAAMAVLRARIKEHKLTMPTGAALKHALIGITQYFRDHPSQRQ